MSLTSARIPVHLVTGQPGTGKTALIRRFTRERNDWLGLVNTGFVQGDSSAANLRPLAPGCPCCTGKLVLQVALARALRETHAARAFVELADPRHAATLAKLLGELPLSLSVVPARAFFLPRDSGVTAQEIDLPWLPTATG